MIHTGDCVEVMRTLEPDSIDAIVTDPPYGLEFMGKEWDRLWSEPDASFTDRPKGGTGPFDRKRASYGNDTKAMQAWHEAWAREAFRVAKPGAHLLAFGGTRTYHRLASAIEDAGWEIRDCLVWAYASGFPKSLDVSKAIDRAAGVEREQQLVPTKPGNAPEQAGPIALGADGMTDTSEPITDEARDWQGWGTALKPAWEPIVMARKPLRGTVAANVLAHGTGALNIDATRIGTDGGTTRGDGPSRPGTSFDVGNFGVLPINAGRWPANLILTDPIFDGGVSGVVGGGSQQSGYLSPEHNRNVNTGNGLTHGEMAPIANESYGDSGTYSRFFIVPKSSRSDREPILRDYALALHRERGECDKLGASPSSTSPARATSEAISTADSPSATSQPGKPPTGRSPRAISSTTSTATSRTIDSPTSSSLTPSLTSASTRVASSAMGDGGSPAESAESSSLWGPLTGTSPEKDGRSTGDADPATSESWSGRSRCADCGKPLPRFSTHPTQKPTDLMRHLVRLVTPPGGTVLDCFLGSGTTAIAAEMEGFAWIGIEKEPEYVAIAEARLNGTQKGMAL